MFGLQRQVEIFSARGSGDDKPAISLNDWEERARCALPVEAFDYVAGGAGLEATMRANREAFSRHAIWPRMLHDVSARDLTVTLFGTRLPAPFLLGPVGVQGVIHPEAELAACRAAVQSGIPFVLSTVSSRSIEQVASEMGGAARWFQLYPARDRAIMRSLVERAEAAGYSCLVVTLDTTALGWRGRDLRHGYLPFLAGEGIVNYLSDPVFRAQLAAPPEDDPEGAVRHFLNVFVNPALSWPDIDFIREQTRLPLVLKGILHPEDAREAIEHGVDGIVVSNHGGRQVDGAAASLDALPAVFAAVNERLPVLMDSGIRCAADILKAVALGARAVLLGRPYVYALAAGGTAGVLELIHNLLAELDLELALSGYATMAELDHRLLSPAMD